MVIKRIANSLGPQTPLGPLFPLRMYIDKDKWKRRQLIRVASEIKEDLMVLALFHPGQFINSELISWQRLPGWRPRHPLVKGKGNGGNIRHISQESSLQGTKDRSNLREPQDHPKDGSYHQKLPLVTFLASLIHFAKEENERSIWTARPSFF